MNDYLPIKGHFSTKAIHAGYDPEDWPKKSIVPPIYSGTAHEMFFPNKDRGFTYVRQNNPTRSVLEKSLAGLDDAEYAIVYSSGVSAFTAVYSLLEKGDHVVSGHQLYPGYYGQIRQMENFGILTSAADTRYLQRVRNAIKPNTKMVFVETPSNPFTIITDLPALSQLIKETNPNILLVVDNTMQTPYFQNPLKFGADIVIYSLSKYMNGHSDIMMGSAVTNRTDLYKKLKTNQIDAGPVPSAMDCFLVHRSLKTLPLRMEKHMENALEVARFLEQHESVEKVYYPGLESHPQYSLAKKLFSGTSGLMSFYLKGGFEETQAFFESTKVIRYIPTFGANHSIMCYGPALFSQFSKEELIEMEVTENFIRLSIGLEDSQDLINDLDQALKKACKL